MISESQQEQGTLYALGPAGRGGGVGLRARADGEPRATHPRARTARKRRPPWRKSPTATTLRPRWHCATGCSGKSPSEAPALASPTASTQASPVAPGKIVPGPFAWVPWAIAALLLGCTVLLALDRASPRSAPDRFESRGSVGLNPRPWTRSRRLPSASWSQRPTPPARPRAAVLWDASQHRGKLRVSQLAAPAAGEGLPAVGRGSREQDSGQCRRGPPGRRRPRRPRLSTRRHPRRQPGGRPGAERGKGRWLAHQPGPDHLFLGKL